MDAMPQVPLGQSNLFLNPDRRCPCVLVLDNSYSMHGPKIDQLNNGVAAFQNDVSRDMVALKRIEIAVVTFGPVKVAQPFTTVDRLAMPPLVADNDTPMGAAVMTGLQLLEDRKRDYRQQGVPYFRPWMFLITDGIPTDDVSVASRAIKQAEASKSLSFFGVGVETADMIELAKLSSRSPLHLNGLSFPQMFLWLSSSLKSISRSTPGQAVPLANPTGPGGWATVSA
jgi:uncharacterized protein YegL